MVNRKPSVVTDKNDRTVRNACGNDWTYEGLARCCETRLVKEVIMHLPPDCMTVVGEITHATVPTHHKMAYGNQPLYVKYT